MFSGKAWDRPGRDRDSALPPAVGKIVGEKMGRLLILADLRAVEEACEELLTAIFRWDGRRFVIAPRRIAEAQAVINGYLTAPRSGAGPADGTTAVKDALKLALTVCLFRREPAPGTVARLKEGYASLGSFRSPRGLGAGGRWAVAGSPGLDERVGEAEKELAEEIEIFCRTLGVLREAAEGAGA